MILVFFDQRYEFEYDGLFCEDIGGFLCWIGLFCVGNSSFKFGICVLGSFVDNFVCSWIMDIELFSCY